MTESYQVVPFAPKYLGGGPGIDVPGGGFDLSALLSVASSKISDVIVQTGSNLAANLLTDLLVKAGLPAGLAQAFGTALGPLPASLSRLAAQASTLEGAGPSLVNPIGQLIRNIRPNPFRDAGGFGGGALTAGPYLGLAGTLAGELLRRKQVKIEQLLTGTGRAKSVIAGLFSGGTLAVA